MKNQHLERYNAAKKLWKENKAILNAPSRNGWGLRRKLTALKEVKYLKNIMLQERQYLSAEHFTNKFNVTPNPKNEIARQDLITLVIRVYDLLEKYPNAKSFVITDLT